MLKAESPSSWFCAAYYPDPDTLENPSTSSKGLGKNPMIQKSTSMTQGFFLVYKPLSCFMAAFSESPKADPCPSSSEAAPKPRIYQAGFQIPKESTRTRAPECARPYLRSRQQGRGCRRIRHQKSVLRRAEL